MEEKGLRKGHSNEDRSDAIEARKIGGKETNEIRLRGPSVGKILRDLRGEMTLGELARRSGIDKGTLMRFETGERGFSGEDLADVAGALDKEVGMVLKMCLTAAVQNMEQRRGGKALVNVLDAFAKAERRNKSK